MFKKYIIKFLIEIVCFPERSKIGKSSHEISLSKTQAWNTFMENIICLIQSLFTQNFVGVILFHCDKLS